jgi:hypothetical protein
MELIEKIWTVWCHIAGVTLALTFICYGCSHLYDLVSNFRAFGASRKEAKEMAALERMYDKNAIE